MITVRRSLLPALLALVACSHPAREATVPARLDRPSILLITLDTTRADAIGPEARGVVTPAFNELAARGLRFRYAYTTVPQTLPAHLSMLTGLYPAGHGVRENARSFPVGRVSIAERLKASGYHTAAFVSAFALARRFGVNRGFELFDDEFGEGKAERTASETTARALSFLSSRNDDAPIFLWVHYYDPHYPYTPPEPFATRYAGQPYYGEVASMDQQLGRLVTAFQQRGHGPIAIVVAGDHGEGLGEHGEAQHGNLLYQATMHVPLLVVGPRVKPGTSDEAVSTRRIFHTILDWAGIDASGSLLGPQEPVLLGEAMKPFLDYGWQPQVMAVHGHQKTIVAGRTEVYDLVADPGENRNLAAEATLTREVRSALRDYPVPTVQAAASPSALPDEDRRKLASLGYVASDVRPVVRSDAPRPADMASLFPVLDRASGLFVRDEYAEAIPLLEQIVAKDPGNLDATLRMAISSAAVGNEAQARRYFRLAQNLAPDSPDVRMYVALHQARGADWEAAAPTLEKTLSEFPDRVAALEALASIRERQHRLEDAVALRQRLYALRAPTAQELLGLTGIAMETGNTAAAIDALQRARIIQGAAFHNDLDLGVLFLAQHRFEEARDALDRVPATHPGHAMALFKRAQVSVLLHEPDAGARIEAARRAGNRETLALIDHERLFQQLP